MPSTSRPRAAMPASGCARLFSYKTSKSRPCASSRNRSGAPSGVSVLVEMFAHAYRGVVACEPVSCAFLTIPWGCDPRRVNNLAYSKGRWVPVAPLVKLIGVTKNRLSYGKRGPGREFPVGHAQGLRLRLRLRPRPRLPLREHPGNGRTLTATTSGYPVNRRYP